MARREFPTRVRIDAFRRADGRCEATLADGSRCTAYLRPGRHHYDHVIPDGLGGEPTLQNCAVICEPCHDEKTRERDVPAIARAKRLEAAHLGAKMPSRNPLPGGRNTPFKRKMDGTIVRRTK